MKSFEEQNKELIKFDKTFNPNDSRDCVQRAMLLLRNREAQMIEEGYEWNIATETCRWAIEQAIINRGPGTTIVDATTEYVENIELQMENYNQIEFD